jgi:hypothetical protein
MTFFQKARTTFIARYCGAGFLFSYFLTFPFGAFAQNDTVFTVTRRLDNNANYLPETLEIVAYLLGLFCLYSAIMALKEFSQEPEKKPFKPALIRFIIAGMLIALPQTIKSVIETYGANPMGMPTALSRPTLIEGLN